MMIRPRPVMPYWPAYPEPERSRLEASYRAAELAWQRETTTTMVLNLAMALLGPLGIALVAWAIWFLTQPY